MRSLGLEFVDILGTDMVVCYGFCCKGAYYWFDGYRDGARRVRSLNAIIRQLKVGHSKINGLNNSNVKL